MKIIIVEGTDRTGKDTLINELKNLGSRVLINHCGKPIGDTHYEQAMNQEKLFNGYINDLFNDRYFGICDLVIFNRAWYGEYVYGTLYRERTKEEVNRMISFIEYDLNRFNDIINVLTVLDGVYYIQLVNDSVKLALSNDDGNSISNDKGNILKEIELFKEVYELSNINKKLIKVNDGDEFRSKEDILNEVLNFINEPK